MFATFRARGIRLCTIGIDNVDALTIYYELLLAFMRVINTTVVSRGQQNEQTIHQAREFLTENRASIVAIFKRSAKLDDNAKQATVIDELVEAFILLISMTSFLDVSA